MASRRINRRMFLGGVGGAAVALPMLEIMLDRSGTSWAADPPSSIPLRYVVCFGGQSMGADNDPQHNDYVPNTEGPGYDLKSALQPFATHGVQDEITVVSGLRIPTASDNGGTIPAGGRADTFHATMLSPLLSGVRAAKNGNGVEGATSDQIVADAIGQGTTFKSLVYRVQAAWYLSVGAPYGRDLLSYRIKGGAATGIPATVSPKAAFDALFYNFATPGDPASDALKDRERRARKSVLDLVAANTERLVGKLGGADRQRLERHLDEIRDLETRIGALPPELTGGCEALPDPGQDPSLGGNQAGDGTGNTGYNTNKGYSGEKERATLLCDLIHMALTCDLTRVASLMITMAQSHMNMKALTGQASDLHEINHNGVPGGTMAVAKAMSWHMDVFAYLVKKLKDTPEGNGSVLDSCALVMLHEGGHGQDPSSGKQYSSHSTENMALCIAGGAGGKLKRGHHVVTTGKHPANVLLTLMNQVGVAGDALGEVTGALPKLLTG